MWLNTIILSLACLLTGFILGWVCGRPRRWDRHVWAETTGPEDLPPLPGGLTTGA
jgi:hypothetical protein